jgi:hypothetical protein
MDGFLKVVGPIGAALIACFVAFKVVENATNTMALLIMAFFAFRQWREEQKLTEMWQRMPKEGPMKVNLEIEQIYSNQHRLHIDIKMTKQDWDALLDAGLGNGTLCTYPSAPSTGSQPLPFMFTDIMRIKYLHYPNGQEVREAKEEIIKNLQYARSHINAQHEFARRPAERKESLEI